MSRETARSSVCRRSELIEDLQRFLDGKPVRVRPVTVWQRAGKWAKRRPVHAALAAVLGTVLLAGLSGLGWARAREKRHQDELGLALDRTHRSERAALHLRSLADRHRAAEELRIAGSLYERGEQEAATSILDALDPTPGLPDSRGFAWYYLDRLCQPRVMRLPSLPEKIVQAAYSNDGRTIALLDRARNIVLVDRETGKYRALQSQHRFHGYHSRCSRRTAAAWPRSLLTPRTGRKTDVKIWDVASGEELAGIAEEFGLCYQLLFSPDGRNLITIEATGTTREVPIRSWRLSDDRKRVTLLESLRADQLSCPPLSDPTTGRLLGPDFSILRRPGRDARGQLDPGGLAGGWRDTALLDDRGVLEGRLPHRRPRGRRPPPHRPQRPVHTSSGGTRSAVWPAHSQGVSVRDRSDRLGRTAGRASPATAVPRPSWCRTPRHFTTPHSV